MAAHLLVLLISAVVLLLGVALCLVLRRLAALALALVRELVHSVDLLPEHGHQRVREIRVNIRALNVNLVLRVILKLPESGNPLQSLLSFARP